jgi:hypothetical protein
MSDDKDGLEHKLPADLPPAEEAAPAPKKPTPITKERIEITVKQMFGQTAECVWVKTTSKKRKTLRIAFTVLGKPAAFEIRDAADLFEIARTVVAIYGRVRGTIVDEMARGIRVKDDAEMKDRIQREKDRMAGRAEPT